MTEPAPVCRHCDEPITDPDDAVYLGHEEANSGPGWEVWTHRAHVHLLRPDPAVTNLLARVLIENALRGPDAPEGEATS